MVDAVRIKDGEDMYIADSVETSSIMSANYATVVPDDEPMEQYARAPRRRSPSPRATRRPVEKPRHVDTKPSGESGNSGSKAPLENVQEAATLKKYISNNKSMVIGLLIIIAGLVSALGYMVWKSHKAESNDVASVNMRSAGSIPGPGPPDAAIQQPERDDGSYPDTRISKSPAAQQSLRNDKILKQRAHRNVPNPNGSHSAMKNYVRGRSQADDDRKLATIAEENEEMDEPNTISEETREHIAKQLRADAEAGITDTPIGTGPLPPLEEDVVGDEANDADIEPEDAQIVQQCDQILASGSRMGQTCGRDCKPGASKCPNHSRRR